MCNAVLNHSCSNCTCPKAPHCFSTPKPQWIGKYPAAANAVPPSKLCPRSSTNSKVMWMPQPLSPHPVFLPSLRRMWGRENRLSKVALSHCALIVPSWYRSESTDYLGVMRHVFLEVGEQGRPGAFFWALSIFSDRIFQTSVRHYQIFLCLSEGGWRYSMTSINLHWPCFWKCEKNQKTRCHISSIMALNISSISGLLFSFIFSLWMKSQSLTIQWIYHL